VPEVTSTHRPSNLRPLRRSTRPPLPSRRPAVRVASVPASHVYVRHLADPDGDDGVVRLDDVPPEDGTTVPGGWWPPVMLDGAWIREHRSTFDVFHVHFGFDAKDPDELRDVVAALDEVGAPLVVTVHDLRNPHHRDRALHEAQLGILVRAADAVLTLTPGAAREVARRWGRHATVVAHPHVVDFERMRQPRAGGAAEPFVVGMHAKSVRANMDPVGVAGTLADVVADLDGAVLRVDLHDELLDPDNHWYAPDLAAELIALGQDRADVDVRVHPYFSDDELWDYLERLDVSVLPYRFGTHSGWLEACHDLGTAVIAPDCGFYAEQSGCLTYRHGDGGLDVASLHAAVRDAYRARRAGADDGHAADRELRIAARHQQRREIATLHRTLYRRLLGAAAGRSHEERSGERTSNAA
jgi:glycosyltransferase involved in cell wall biosynthesis